MAWRLTLKKAVGGGVGPKGEVDLEPVYYAYRWLRHLAAMIPDELAVVLKVRRRLTGRVRQLRDLRMISPRNRPAGV
jgi:hypothetical protein